jgi:hypothetical protein
MPKNEVPFRRSVVRAILAMLWTFPSSSVFADSSTASLSISVSDSSGAVVPGAHIVLRNAETNQEQQAESGTTGSATFSFLKPGHYTLTISKESFADVIVDRILLNVGDDKQLHLSLKVGTASQTVNVDGSGLTINTTDASVSTVVDRKFVGNMPLNGRSFQDLIQMTPGVVTQSPQSSGQVPGYQGDFSVNGQRTESNYYTVDGVSAAGAGEATGGPQAASSGSIAASSALGTTQSILSVDALQEFRVSSSTYSAEYGRSPGGQFAFSTRSGTNEMHGSAFEYLRNDAADANDWFNNFYGKRKSALRQNDFGGTLGGPIWIPRLYRGTDRSFFFVSYEGLRLVQPAAASTQYVPSLAVRSSASAALQDILNAFPLPTGAEITSSTGAPTGFSPFVASYALPAAINSTSVRLDHTFASKLALFFRFANTPTYSQTRNLSQVGRSSLTTSSYTLGATSQLSRRVNNEFRAGYTDSRSSAISSLDSFGGATPADLRAAMGIPNGYSSSQVTPYLYIPSVGTSYLNLYDTQNKLRQWNITDNLSLTIGHHLLRVGIDERHFASPMERSPLNIFAEFLSRQSMVSNAADYAFLSKNVSATPVFNEFSAFGQDEWRAWPSLTLSLGLRWEINPPPTEANGNEAYTVLGDINSPATLTLAPRGTPLWKTSWFNFAPRLGLAWTANTNPGWETVVRTGGGAFFDTGNQLAAQGFSGLGFYAYQSYFGASLPVQTADWTFSTAVASPYTVTYIEAFPVHMQLPYTLQWNASVEQALGNAQSLTMSYVASNGRRLLQQQSRNVSSSNPAFGTIYYVATDVTSNYQSLQLKFQRSISHGLQCLVSYAWSHSLDYGSNNAALPLTRGNADFDVRHNLQAGSSWELPVYRGNRLLGSLVNNWSTDHRVMMRTGFPITLKGKYITDPATGNYYGNVNVVPNEPLYLYSSQYPGGRTVNPAAFSYPTNASVPGTAPRNFVRGFGEMQWNTALRREFHLRDAFTAQFRAEAFNVLNHPNFGYVDPTLSDAQFGRATSMLNQSLGSVSPLYQQGGSRSMQFELKVQF